MTPLRQGGMVDLVFADQHRRAARVREIGHQYAILVPLGSAQGDPDARAEASIEALGPDGLLRMHGEVRALGSGRFRFDPMRPYEELQRRRHPRVPSDRQVLVERGAGQTLTGMIVDLSGGGMRVRTRERLAVDQIIRVAIDWDEAPEPVRGPATVLRDDGDGIFAVRFDAWPEPIVRSLRELIAIEQLAHHRAA